MLTDKLADSANIVYTHPLNSTADCDQLADYKSTRRQRFFKSRKDYSTFICALNKTWHLP